ncbi:hypothetical protein GMLC_36600 [Geomonas limicola]|uniref:Uncharacterized protein n=1 Tax=Geomonas limicola TaxID=2740186 RepID=A0A6V8NC29_9BACT|nr:hypothetical protein [Geomonas limicola]GFO70081.1 hypothetical protein GMLC_36600 [Geomonas limicola]
MKWLLTCGGVGLLTSALLDPVIYATLEKPIPWWRDLLMGAAGIVCVYLLVKYRRDL